MGIPVNDAADIETPIQGLSFVSRSLLPFYVEMVSGPALSIFIANSILTIQVVPGVTVTDQVVGVINASPILQPLLYAVNNSPGTTIRQHPKTLLRPFVSGSAGDSDINGTSLTFELVSSPTYEVPNGTTLSSNGDLEYEPQLNHNSSLPGVTPNTLTYRVIDRDNLASTDQIITLNVVPVNDISLATSTQLNLPVINEDDLNVPLATLGWQHPDADTADDVETCTIVAPNNVLYATSDCTANTLSVSEEY